MYTSIDICVSLYTHRLAHFCMFSAENCPSQARPCQGAPRRPGLWRSYLGRGKVTRMGHAMLSMGPTFGARCCLITWSLEPGEGHLQEGGLLEGEKGPRGKFCSHSYAAAVDYAAARDSPGLWAPDAALSSWVILLRGFGRTILIKIRTDSELCLRSLLSLILHVPEDEQTQQGYR